MSPPIKVADIPLRSFDAIYHVGSMVSSQKRTVSLEGSGLSVSMHPNVWRFLDQGWVHGDLWLLERQGSRFVDRLAMPVGVKANIATWATERGYVSEADWTGCGYQGHDKLWARFSGMVPHLAQSFDFALIAYLEDEHPEIDGIWWDERLTVVSKRKGGSAPRGVIFADRLDRWQVARIPEEAAPDIGLFPKRRRMTQVPPIEDRVAPPKF